MRLFLPRIFNDPLPLLIYVFFLKAYAYSKTFKAEKEASKKIKKC